MSKLFGYGFLLFTVLAIVSCFKRNDIPQHYMVSSALQDEPVQKQIHTKPFNVNYGGVNYTVTPEYSYELYGLVVSFRHHDGDSMLHKLWNDHLNSADVCVVWSQNTDPSLLSKLDIWNGQFTCNVKTKDSLAWSRFNMDQLSNNHLISEKESIRNQIEKMRIGDQVRIQGQLASYASAGGGKRGTSTTRTDTGNGACETIYVEDFQVLATMPSAWRTWLWFSLIASPLCLIGYFFSPHTRPK